jgi:hypothetical protein
MVMTKERERGQILTLLRNLSFINSFCAYIQNLSKTALKARGRVLGTILAYIDV